MYVYKTTSRFTSTRKYKLIRLLSFIFTRRYSPSEKQASNLFTQFRKFSNFKPIKKKTKNKKKPQKTNGVTLILSIYCKGKISSNSKIRKMFLVSYDFAFVIAYIISMMRTGFLMANTFVHK